MLLSELENFPNLQDIVRFYFELFNLVNIEKDEFIVNHFGGLNPLIAGKILGFILINQSNFPIKFDVKLLDGLHDETNETQMSQASLTKFFALLESCQSTNDFNNKILSEQYSGIYLELIQFGFPYLPEVISLEETDLYKMKEKVSSLIRKITGQHSFGLFNTFVQYQGPQGMSSSPSLATPKN